MRSFNAGEIYGGIGDGYANKPRPVLILQKQESAISDSEVVCLVTSKENERLNPLRYKLTPTKQNGLKVVSWVMIDKLTVLNKSELGSKYGEVSENDMHNIRLMVADMLGIDDEFAMEILKSTDAAMSRNVDLSS